MTRALIDASHAGVWRRWFPALAERNVRVYLLGQWASITGTWVLDVTLNLLAWKLTGSPAVLGLLNFLLYGPGVLVTPLFAARLTADNARSRTLWVLVGALAVALLLAGLAVIDRLALPLVLTLAAARGILNGLEVPSRQMLLTTHVVGPEHLGGAVALNTVVFQLGRTCGPAIAGVLFGYSGPLSAFVLAAVTLGFMLVTVLRLDPRHAPQVTVGAATATSGLRGAVRFVRGDRFGRLFLPVLMCLSLFAGAYQTLVPVLADRIFGDTTRWTSTFFGAVGAGALLSALLLSTQHMQWFQRRLLVPLPWLTAAALIALGFSRSPVVSIICFALIGFGMVFLGTAVNAGLHQRVPPEARGGIIALFLMSYLGAMPLSQLLAGALAQWLPVLVAVRIMGAALVMALLLLFVPRWRSLGRLELDGDRI